MKQTAVEGDGKAYEAIWGLEIDSCLSTHFLGQLGLQKQACNIYSQKNQNKFAMA